MRGKDLLPDWWDWLGFWLGLGFFLVIWIVQRW